MGKNLALAAVFCVFALAGCKEEHKGSVKILSITPEPTTALRVGQKVEMQAEIEYSLSWSDGTTDLVVQDKAAKSLLQSGLEMAQLKQGSGKVTLKRSFVVPDTPEVHVFVPLYPGRIVTGRESSTGIVETRTYNVIRTTH